MSLTAVSYAVAEQCICRAFATQKVPFIEGPPGIGKSGLVHSIADKYNLQLIDVRLAFMEATDLSGLPAFNNDKSLAHFVPFSVWPLEGTKLPKGKVGWLLFLDELPQADRAVIKASYKLILDRMIGEHKLNEKVWIVAAGNGVDDGAHSEEMGGAMTSRFSPKLTLLPDATQWADWANRQGIDHRITSFIEFRPDLIHNYDPDSADDSYPCPRTWQMVHDHLKNEDLKSDALKDIYLPLLAGTIGQGATLEFVAYTELFDQLPTISDIISSPATVEYLDKPDVVYALSGLLAEHAHDENLDQMMIFINRFAGEFQALTIKTIINRKAALRFDKRLTDWVHDNAAELTVAAAGGF